jgi:hypothetical protein
MGVIHNFAIADSDPPADTTGIYTAQADLEPVLTLASQTFWGHNDNRG